MAWVRGGDTSATFPPVMKTAGLVGADDRTVNEVFGFICRLAFLSAAHTTDYVVDAGTVDLIGGKRADKLIQICTKVGLLTKQRVDGFVVYRLIEDPEFLHLRLKAEIEWERQQRADGKNRALAGPIRLRDGDLCRYCGVMVMWLGRPSANTGTLDHLNPGEPGTVDTMVVACRGCNSELRDIGNREHEGLRPVPVEPFYSANTAKWLTDRGYPVDATPRPDSQSDDAPRTNRKIDKRQRTDSQSDTAPGDSDPAQTGPRAPATPEADQKSTSNQFAVAIGTSNAGSGRDGSGTDPLLGPASPPTKPPGRRRKRSARGRPRAPEAP